MITASPFLSAIADINNFTETTNGALAHKSTLDPVLNFFASAPASRGKDLFRQFSMAFKSDPDLAVRALLYTRDVRGGAGERQVFRIILKRMAAKKFTAEYSETLHQLIPYVPFYGRWDDLLVLSDTEYFGEVADLIGKAIISGDALAAKWMPRKGPIAAALRTRWEMTPKQYRKLLVLSTNVVETAMCARKWEDIEFEKLPSLASARYQKAFERNSKKYAEYVTKLEAGETTVNAGALYPYDVLQSLKNGNKSVANAQWNALPDFLDGSTENILTVADVSGSMSCPAGGSNTLTCMDVCISLAMYISERSRGICRDSFITFHTSPALETLKGDLSTRYRQLKNADWGGTTNLVKSLELIVKRAQIGGVAQEDMPTMLLVLSDMQFNSRNGGLDGTSFELVKRLYIEAGYTVPKIVFWNLNHSANFPATANMYGVAMVAGFSPSILKSILNSSDMLTPVGMMLETLSDERYNWTV